MSRNFLKLVLALIAGLATVSSALAADCTSPIADKSKVECTTPTPRAVSVKVLDAASGLVMKDDGQTIVLEYQRPAPVRTEPMIRVRNTSTSVAPQMVTLAW